MSDLMLWRWMKYLGFSFCDRKKSYYRDKHENESNILFHKKIIKNFPMQKKYLPMGPSDQK